MENGHEILLVWISSLWTWLTSSPSFWFCTELFLFFPFPNRLPLLHSINFTTTTPTSLSPPLPPLLPPLISSKHTHTHTYAHTHSISLSLSLAVDRQGLVPDFSLPLIKTNV